MAKRTAALEEELLGLRERADQDLELAQIGMATEVLTHELDLTIVGLRSALDRLDGYVATTPKLTAVYNDLRTGFDHLDTYLALFTPLQRRLTRRTLLIKEQAKSRRSSAIFLPVASRTGALSYV